MLVTLMCEFHISGIKPTRLCLNTLFYKQIVSAGEKSIFDNNVEYKDDDPVYIMGL